MHGCSCYYCKQLVHCKKFLHDVDDDDDDDVIQVWSTSEQEEWQGRDAVWLGHQERPRLYCQEVDDVHESVYAQQNVETTRIISNIPRWTLVMRWSNVC